MYQKFGKRFLDIVFSLLGLIILFIPMLLIYVLVRIDVGKPVIFKQNRPGKDEKIFTLYKFRTMNEAKDENGKLLLDTKRITKLGSILRKLSLDELPQFFNILKGDMSFVGPRPLLIEYLPLYTPEQKHRHDVRPGLTGLAQVNGRNAVMWEDRFHYDEEYVKHVTLWGDFKILVLTFFMVFQKKGINSEKSEATMEVFKGDSKT